MKSMKLILHKVGGKELMLIPNWCLCSWEISMELISSFNASGCMGLKFIEEGELLSFYYYTICFSIFPYSYSIVFLIRKLVKIFGHLYRSMLCLLLSCVNNEYVISNQLPAGLQLLHFSYLLFLSFFNLFLLYPNFSIFRSQNVAVKVLMVSLASIRNELIEEYTRDAIPCLEILYEDVVSKSCCHHNH